ncbi:MAG: YbhB/YbcL family Raf kinase inhibitor-like protein [Methylacidiphilales bacterium]|nr:YbhB/YbcL family Raf kinase inhibitor-like protein [Candidatus Methylacidiphilales bacterium]
MRKRFPWALGSCRLVLPLFFILISNTFADTGMSLHSPAFGNGDPIPTRHGYRHENISPELAIENVPAAAKSLVLICTDPDAPSGVWTHWLLWNIPPDTQKIPDGKTPPGAVAGKNDFGNTRYDGPSPPSGTHRYYFQLFALDVVLELKSGEGRAALETAVKGHVISSATLMGTCKAGN